MIQWLTTPFYSINKDKKHKFNWTELRSKHSIKEDQFMWFDCVRMHNLHSQEKPLEWALLMIQKKLQSNCKKDYKVQDNTHTHSLSKISLECS